MKMRGKRRLNVSMAIGVLLIACVVVMCVSSFIYVPHDPNEMNVPLRFREPGDENGYLLGTDHYGRDILSRIMVGSRTVLLVGVLSVAVGALIGIFLGAVAAIFKRFVGSFIMRAVDGLMAFPGILLAMMLVTVVGRGVHGSIIAIGIFMIPVFSRLVYSMILDTENLLYIKASRSHGSTWAHIFFHHFIPVMLPRLITQFSSSVGSAVMIEASLSFLGLGIQPPDASWGLMLSEAKQYFLQYPYLAVAPGVAIIVTVLGFNLLGDGLNDMIIRRRAQV